MVAKKRAVRGRTVSPDAREFSVVLEDIRSQFGVFGEALQGLREHMDQRFETMDQELGFVKAAVLANTRELKEHGRELKEHGRELKELRDSVERVESNLGGKVDRTEVAGMVKRALRG